MNGCAFRLCIPPRSDGTREVGPPGYSFCMARRGISGISLVLLVALLAMVAPGAYAANWLPARAIGEMHVVVPGDASETLSYAGEVCRKYLQTCTYQEIGLSPYNEGRFNVWLGAYAVTEDILPPDDLEGLGNEGCLVRTFKPSPRQERMGATEQLVIAGETDLGTRHGVFLFLEDYAGFRWLAPGVVRMDTFGMVLPEYARRFIPPVSFREVSGHALLRNPDGPFAASEEAFLEYRRAHGFAHDRVLPPPPVNTLAALLPAKEFPQCYHEGVLCLSRAETTAALAGVLAKQARDGAGCALWGHDGDILVLSGGAAPAPCGCAACAALRVAEDGAAPLITLANRVAGRLREAMAEPRPRILALCLGAWRAPPRSLRAEDDVIVMLSTRLCNGARRLFDGGDPANRSFREDMAAWGGQCAALYVWYWASNQAAPLCPHPVWETLQSDMQFFDQYGAAGVYAQANPAAAHRYAAFAPLRTYLLSNCIYNPDATAQLAAGDFLDTYCGAAAPEMRALLRVLTAHIENQGAFLEHQPAPYWLTQELVVDARERFHTALGKELPAAVRKRVELAELPVLYAALVCPPHVERVGDALVLSRPPAPELDAFVALLRARGAAGDRADDPLVRQVRAACGGKTPPRRQVLSLVALKAAGQAFWLAPEADGAVVRWRARAPEAELFRRFKHWGAPGAWTERANGKTVSGWRVVARTPGKATLAATLSNGCTLEKQFAVEGDGGLRFALTLRNTGAEPAECGVETRPEFLLQDGATPELRCFTNGEWTGVKVTPEPPARVAGRTSACADSAEQWAVRLAETGPVVLVEAISAVDARLCFEYDIRDNKRYAVLGFTQSGAPVPAGGQRRVEAVYRVIPRLP